MEPVNVNEYQEIAKQVLPKAYYDYIANGAEDEHTLKENVKAFSRIIILPRILKDVSHIDLSTKILGHHISAPILVAPTSFHKFAHPEGEIATARAVAECKTIMVVSFTSSTPWEDIALRSNDTVQFFQLYMHKRRDITTWVVQRVEKCGFKAVVVTVDRPRLGRRESSLRNRFNRPQMTNLKDKMSTAELNTDNTSGPQAFANSMFDFDDAFCWKDLQWLKSITKLPILLKGILTHEDAIKAVEAGVAGIVVSNHGGRQLDYAPPTISVLEEIVNAVGGKLPILVDGGVRRGTDIFKALALGAQAVLVGRPILYGLAAKGKDGAKRVLEMLKDELELTMALAGCRSVEEINRKHVKLENEGLQSKL